VDCRNVLCDKLKVVEIGTVEEFVVVVVLWWWWWWWW
jgi:hypothetical protein